MIAKDIMTETIISVTPDHGVRHAAQLMLNNHLSGLPVIDDEGRLAGILSEGDLMERSELGTAAASVRGPLAGAAAARQFMKSHSWRVGDAMTKHVLTVEETTSVDRLAVILRSNNIKRLPVMRGDKVIGIVSRADIICGILHAPPDNCASGDDAIQRAVSTRLYTELKLDPTLVVVTADDGNVHLSGAVRSETERAAALVAAETVHGVRGVRNDLHVLGKSSSGRGQAIAN